jgi:hypothetical protein
LPPDPARADVQHCRDRPQHRNIIRRKTGVAKHRGQRREYCQRNQARRWPYQKARPSPEEEGADYEKGEYAETRQGQRGGVVIALVQDRVSLYPRITVARGTNAIEIRP